MAERHAFIALGTGRKCKCGRANGGGLTGNGHLCSARRVRLLEEAPDFGLEALQSGERAVAERVEQAEALVQLFLRHLRRVQVQLVDYRQRLLRVAVPRVRHPAAGLHAQGA